jgi:hypothetical protein
MTTSHSGGTLPGSRWSQPPEQTSDRPTFSQATPRAAACPINGVPLTDTAEQSFGDFPIHPDIVAALADHGITHPFPIQAMTLPVALGRTRHHRPGQDRHRQDARLRHPAPARRRRPPRPEWATRTHARKPQALAVAPTRELAVQVAADLERAGKRRGIRVLTIYGGRAPSSRRSTPSATGRRGGRRHTRTPHRPGQAGPPHLSRARTVVLDEADEMLDLGFLPDVEKILAMTPRTVRRCSSRRPCPAPSWRWRAAT